MKERQPKFDSVLAMAIHEGLSSISPSISSVVLFYLRKEGLVSSDCRIDDPEAFEEGLKRIFGFGAKIIEKRILELLYLKLDVPRKIKHNSKFAEEVKHAQKLYDSPDMISVKAR